MALDAGGPGEREGGHRRFAGRGEEERTGLHAECAISGDVGDQRLDGVGP